ncbi:unnamed protein product [Dicrocoelium dendriticum]|nr:unnamed protein product [Dicrocoelium dendriticum]
MFSVVPYYSLARIPVCFKPCPSTGAFGRVPRIFKRQYCNHNNLSSRTPVRLRPYVKLARYDKPIGTWLLYLPCTWSIALAATPGHFPDMKLLAIFAVGAILMRGAGCTINDLMDQNFDRQVERTKSRPLACGDLTSRAALAFLCVQLSAAFAVLLQLNYYSVGLGSLSLLLVTTYPLFKRFTYWPQLVLGFAFNWGALLGYAAVVGHFDPLICIPLYVAGIKWTLIYDTVYAFQDIEDDLSIGVKSLAILFGNKTKSYLTLFHLGMFANLLLVGVNINATWIYYFGTAITMAHLGHLIYKTDLRSPSSCLSTFNAGRTTGLIYFTTIVLEKLFTSTPV